LLLAFAVSTTCSIHLQPGWLIFVQAASLLGRCGCHVLLPLLLLFVLQRLMQELLVLFILRLLPEGWL
jgi:hypothetical protein